MNIKDKIILITGASKGIGKAAAIQLAKKGATIVLNYNNDSAGASEVLAEISEYSPRNLLLQADITKEDQVKVMFDTIKSKFGKLDVLINNAGIFDDNESPTNLEVFNKIYQTNFFAHIMVTKYALELLHEGKIINISSVHGRLGHGSADSIAYGAFKAALDHYTKNLAKTLAPKILVNGIAPGRTLTPMWGDMSAEDTARLGSGQLIDRFITPEEIAHAVVFLLENDAMCGEIVTVDGGMTLKTLG